MHVLMYAVLGLSLVSMSEQISAACKLSDIGPGDTGVVFQHKDWSVKRDIVGKEWVGMDCVGYVTHTKISICSVNRQYELCIEEDQGRVSISGASQLTIDNKVYDVSQLSHNTNNDFKTPDWIKRLASSRGPVIVRMGGESVAFSTAGSSAALRFGGLVK